MKIELKNLETKEWAKNLAIRKHRLIQATFSTGGEMNELHEG